MRRFNQMTKQWRLFRLTALTHFLIAIYSMDLNIKTPTQTKHITLPFLKSIILCMKADISYISFNLHNNMSLLQLGWNRYEPVWARLGQFEQHAAGLCELKLHKPQAIEGSWAEAALRTVHIHNKRCSALNLSSTRPHTYAGPGRRKTANKHKFGVKITSIQAMKHAKYKSVGT